IREIASKLGLGGIRDIKTLYHPYIFFTFTYDKRKGLLRRRIVQKEGESVLDGNWRSYPIENFDDFFLRSLSSLCAEAVEGDVSSDSITRIENADPKTVVKSAFEAIIYYVTRREEELVNKALQVDEKTRPLIREADRLSSRGHIPPRDRTGLISRARAAETIMHHVRSMKNKAKKEQEKFRKEVLKKMRKSLGAPNIKEILHAKLVYCPRHTVTYERGGTEIFDHNGRRIRESKLLES
ncbi:MAG: hypothetical protein ACFFBS_10000, partial [Promethearchaeota archaeon]